MSVDTPTRTAVASTTSVVDIIKANGSRKGAVIRNASTAVLTLIFGSGGSSSDYTDVVAANSTYTFSGQPYPYNGLVQGFWASVNGSAFVTELT